MARLRGDLWNGDRWGSRRWGQDAPEYFGQMAWERDPEIPLGEEAPALRYAFGGDGVTGPNLILTLADGTEILYECGPTDTAAQIAALLSGGAYAWTAEGGPLGTADVTVESQDFSTDDGVDLRAVVNSVETFAAAPPDSAASGPYPARKYFWQFDVVDEDGVTAKEIRRLIEGRCIEFADRPGQVRLRVDGAEGWATEAFLAAPGCRLVMRDRWRLVSGMYLVTRYSRRRDGVAVYVEIEAEGLLAQLATEALATYEYSGSVADCLADLLAQQLHPTPLTLGEISPAIGAQACDLSLSDTTILGAIQALRRQLSAALKGYVYVDGSGAVCWAVAIGDDMPGLSAQDAVYGLRLTSDYSRLATRLYAYGAGDAATGRLNLTDAGEAEEYIEENTGTYGVRPAVWVDESISDADALLAAAQAELAERSTPRLEIEADLLDLAIAPSHGGRTGTPWDSMQDITIAGAYQISDSALGVSETAYVTRLERDIARPLAVRVDLATRPESLADVLGKTTGAGSGQTASPIPGDTRWHDGGAEMWDGDSWEDIASGAASDDTPQPIGEAAAGTSEALSRDDHVHAVDSGTYAELPAGASDGAIFYATDRKALYLRRDSAWVPLLFYGGSKATLEAIDAHVPQLVEYTGGSTTQLVISRPGGGEYAGLERLHDDDLEP